MILDSQKVIDQSLWLQICLVVSGKKKKFCEKVKSIARPSLISLHEQGQQAAACSNIDAIDMGMKSQQAAGCSIWNLIFVLTFLWNLVSSGIQNLAYSDWLIPIG